ncbi:hypothetical protein RHSIM_Rhsim02G0067900 [Rhododendron simsii]|uniref:Uncharacterized protein n=1 Tax=Rhododendron simsii TaxID=118357 RepID=A0A834HI85_RHOSS|nr:hypothetical protein RHSIM_Rhsim02G0067900 [Rhododendron simsii]
MATMTGAQINDRYGEELKARGSEAVEKLLKSEAERALPLLKEHFDVLDYERNAKVLVNTFDALESGALRAKLNFVAIGPLIPSAFLDGKDPSDASFGGDLFQDSKAYIEW